MLNTAELRRIDELCYGTVKRYRREGMARIVGRCLAGELEIYNEPVPWRWPLERRLTHGATLLPIASFSPAEVVGGYVRLRLSVVSGAGATVHAGAVLPAVSYDNSTQTYTLRLDEARPPDWCGMIISNVPPGALDIVAGMKYTGGQHGSR